MIDLRIGNPEIFFEMLSGISDSMESSLISGMPYHKEKPISIIINQIKELHKKYHPNLLTPNSQIVVGSGAGQLISAFFSLNSKTFVQSPFWFRVPVLSKKHNSNTEYKTMSEGINLITYPSNPDGKIELSGINTWYDCVYLWPWYFSDKKQYNDALQKLTNTKKIATIFTLSKMTGHCGTRFGWAIVEDKETENKINEYMEIESGGLGYDTQVKAATIIESVLEKEHWQKQLLKINQKLNQRKKEFYYFTNKNNWFYEAKPGMFAWITVQSNNATKEFERKGILGTCGSICGGTKQQIRLNLAVNDDTWERVLKLLS